MFINITDTCIHSDDMLNELICQSLEKIVGPHHHLISRDIPFLHTPTKLAILALDSLGRPALIIFDHHHGSEALISGLKILDSFHTHHTWAAQLFPEPDRNGHQAPSLEEIQLYILAPTPPPGTHYMSQGLTSLHVFTFQPLLINGETGLFIKPMTTTNTQADKKTPPMPTEIFRTGMNTLEKSEEDYFRNLNIMR